MNNLRLLFICTIWFVMPVVYGSEEEITENETPIYNGDHTLDEYLQYLISHNPEFARLSEEAAALRAEIPAAKSLSDPTVGIGWFLNPVETRVGPQEQKVSIRQKIPWGGKRELRAQILETRSQQVEAKLEQSKREKTAKFKKAYGELFYLGREIKSTQEHLGILGNFEEVLTTKYQAGLSSYANLIRVQLETDKLKDRITELKARHKPVAHKLLALLGVASQNMPHHKTEMEGELNLIPFPQSLPETDLITQEHEVINNPQLSEISFKTQQQKAVLALEDRRSMPDFQFGLDWIGTGNARVPGVRGSGDDPVAISVSMNVPIWSRKYRALKKASAHRIEASEKNLLNRKNQLSAELQAADYRYEDAKRKVSLYRDLIIPKAKESLSVLLTAFESDQASYLDILDAERALLEFTLSLEKAKSNVFIAFAEIERITG